MSKSYKVPTIKSFDGGESEMDYLLIRGVPHEVSRIRELERAIGITRPAQVVTDEIVLANLDRIFQSHQKRHGKPPLLLEDTVTRDRFVPVEASIPSVTGVLIKTYLYFRLPRSVVSDGIRDRRV